MKFTCEQFNERVTRNAIEPLPVQWSRNQLRLLLIPDHCIRVVMVYVLVLLQEADQYARCFRQLLRCYLFSFHAAPCAFLASVALCFFVFMLPSFRRG